MKTTINKQAILVGSTRRKERKNIIKMIEDQIKTTANRCEGEKDNMILFVSGVACGTLATLIKRIRDIK